MHLVIKFIMKKILVWWWVFVSIFLWSLFSISCVSADYTDREVSRAVESLVTKGAWAERKPLLEKIEGVLPRAIERFENSQVALTILEQIQKAVTNKLAICTSDRPEQNLKKLDLSTDTSIRSIELDEVLSGGPPKDGIPALTNPTFKSIQEALDSWYILWSSDGIVVEDGNTAKFYPYNILNRHEIVNDVVWDKNIAITFCPLCGTAIVFDREFDGDVIEFGVSWLLYNSNLLMYDNRSESLRSQAIGKWVIWFYTDKQLEYIDSDVINFDTFQSQYPDGLVLSDETWFSRNYNIDSPYGDYDSNDDLYFPVSNIDSSLPKKTLLYVVNDVDNELSIAFMKSELKEWKSWSITANGITYTATEQDGIVTVIRDSDNKELATFVQMRFSWTAHEWYPRHLWGADK